MLSLFERYARDVRQSEIARLRERSLSFLSERSAIESPLPLLGTACEVTGCNHRL
jgi:hypothetical protein